MSLMDDSITVIRQTQQNAFEYGDEAVNKAFDLLDSAVNTANNTAWIPLQPNPSYSVTFPPPIPSWDTSIIPDTKAQSALAFLNDWLEKYRLIINENFSKLYSFDLAESEIENIIQNGYIIKKTIHDQIVTRVMDSESMKSFGLREDATKSFISKGWTIPNSILLSRIDAINADYSKNVSQAIRDQSIREEELNTDMIKFAVQEALNLKPRCIELATNFASRYANMYQYNSEAVRAYISGLGIVNDSINNYNRLIYSQSELGIRDLESWRDYDLRAKTAQVNLEMDKAKIKTSTALQSGEVYATIARAALSSQMSLTNLSAGTVQTNQ